jgi:hypothetical protein
MGYVVATVAVVVAAGLVYAGARLYLRIGSKG